MGQIPLDVPSSPPLHRIKSNESERSMSSTLRNWGSISSSIQAPYNLECTASLSVICILTSTLVRLAMS